MKSIRSQLSKQYIDEMGILEQIPEDKSVSFCNVKAGVWTPAVGRHVTPSGLHIPGKVQIRDPYAKGDKLKFITYTIDFDEAVQDGQQVLKGKPQYVRFGDNGYCVCTSPEYEQYLFLMVHNKRRENPFRIKSVENAARFYLVDEKRDAFKFVAKFDHEVLAGAYMNEADMPTLMGVIRNLNAKKVHFVDLNSEEGFLRQELVKIIREDPMAFLLATGDNKFKAKLLIDGELADNNILFDEQKRQFYWRAKTGKDAVICEVAAGNKPQLALVEYATGKEGGKFFNELRLRDEKHQGILTQ